MALQGNADDDENRETNDNLPEDLSAEMDLASREKTYHRHFIQLQSLVVEKIKEVEEVTAEKEELERSVQNALQKGYGRKKKSCIANERPLLSGKNASLRT